MAEKKLKTLQFEGLNTTYVLPEVDPTSSISGDAADAKIVGDHLTDINNPHGVTLEQLGASKTIVTDENEDGHIILKSYLSDSGSGNISTHISDRSNPHKVTAVQVGADVSGAAKQALEDAKGYTDEVITNLIGGAPDTLNTLQELAEAMGANAEVVEVLEKAITGKADNSVLTTHIDNKNNPHNVTIDQIGAAPASTKLWRDLGAVGWYKVGTIKSETDLHFAACRLLIGGAYYYDEPPSAIIDVTSNYSALNAMVTVPSPSSAGVTKVGFVKSAVKTFDVYVYYNHSRSNGVSITVEMLRGVFVEGDFEPASVSESDMSKVVVPSVCSFAPSGYGLGAHGIYCSDCNSATKNGWYRFDASTLNIAPSASQGSLFVRNAESSSGVIVYQTMWNGYWRAYRFYGPWDNTWSEWEFENPPMQVGVEYRTTERWQGNVVYTMMVDCGAAANGKTTTPNIGNGTIFKFVGRTVGYALPMLHTGLSSTYMMYLYCDNGSVTIMCGSAMVGKQTYCQIWYYKA